MRKVIKHFAEICAENLPILEPIYEFGSLQVPGQADLADLRPLFPGKEYVGCDMREGPGVDRILDLHKIDLPSGSVGTVILLDTLEHVEFVREAIKEVYRILKPNGILMVSSVMNFRIHDHPHDYWRFTPEAFKSLLEPFSSSFVDSVGERSFPHTVVGIGFKGPVPGDDMDVMKVKAQDWKDCWNSSWRERARQVAPPILLNAFRKKRFRMMERWKKVKAPFVDTAL